MQNIGLTDTLIKSYIKMTEHRRLAVVLFADIAGYTALMQKDEAIAMQLLQRFKQELFQSVKDNNGEIIQYFGDGCLVVFTNAPDAVLAAKTIQEKLMIEPMVPVRIGLHLGDVIYREGNIFGDCVNIASRIESMGVPGAILFSDAVKKQIRNKPEFRFTSLGSFDFKNVEEPIEVFALSHNGFAVPDREKLAGKFKEGKAIKSIAVLPFINMSNDPEQEYFSDGIAEEILNSLTHLKELKVAGRLSSFQFKGKDVELKEVGEKLGVRTVLQGSVRKQGNRVRVTTQLINVADGYHLWSDRYDKELNDIFSIQEEIALSVTEALRLTLLQKDREQLTRTHTHNPEAYELYLKGLFHINKRGAHIFTSIQYFQKAIELDTDFALAYSLNADAHLLIATYGLMPPKQVMTKAKELAEAAIRLDSTLCEPYHALGFYYTCIEWNWVEAKKYFLDSIRLNPKYAEAHYRYGWNYLTWVEGDFHKAMHHGELAVHHEPLSSICHATYSLILFAAGNFKEATAACNMGIELEPNSFLCLMNKGSIQTALHQYEDAIATCKTAMAVSNRHHFAVNGLIWNYCKTGRYDEARALLNELKERNTKEYIAATFTGISAAYLNDLEEAFLYFEKAFNDKDPILLTLKYLNWVPENLRSDPRFQSLLDRIGYPN
jgi:pentatricopeptide repeat protein